jgi:retron-type reverse transcriptase
MINNMNQILTEKHIGEHQHGFVPGRGTMTAWMDILKNVLNSKFIYETDLKGFFDNISTATINKFSGDFDIAPILKM